MIPRVIKTEQQCAEARTQIEELMFAMPGTPEGDQLDLWVTLVDLYEKQTCPIDPPDPIEAIRFRMEQEGLRQQDLVPFIGSASKVSEVLSGRRSLSLSMIRRLSQGLGIPAESLLRRPSDEPRGNNFSPEATAQAEKHLI